MANKTVKTDQSKSYFSAIEALEDNGYSHLGKYGSYNAVFNKWHQWQVFEKDSRKYKFMGMDHYNTTIYSISLAPMSDEQFARCEQL